MIEKNSKAIMLIIFTLICIYFVYKNIQFDNKLETNYEYTIGKATEYCGRGGTSRSIVFKYFVNGKLYEGSTGRDYNLKNPLKKFYKVKYSKTDPEISEIYLNEEITDSIEITSAGFK